MISSANEKFLLSYAPINVMPAGGGGEAGHGGGI